MDAYKMWIGGEWVEASSGKTYPVINPTTEEVFAEVALGDKEDVEKAVAAACKALPVWSGKTQDERTNMLNQMAEALRKQVPEIAELDVMDHGTPKGMAFGMVSGCAPQLEWSGQAARALMGEHIPSSGLPNTLFWLRREPIGVCALIIPWNGPLNMAVMKASQALAVGCTVVIKPPSIDSITTLKWAETLQDLDIPPGTINIVTGPGGTVGEELASHAGIDFISFTGSSETGRRIMELASKTVKRLGLELGGKNPYIVLADADVDRAVNKAVMCTQLNSGQICASPGRYYVHEKLYDEFVEKYIAGASKWVVGDPNDEKTMMGPVVSAEHRAHIERLVRIGKEEGARLVLGGERPTEPPLNRGYFVVPTAFADVTQNMTIAREEIFGPVACIMKYADEDEVIDLANDNIYGLSASIWTTNAFKGVRFANAINAGAVWINDHMIIGNELPWGGFKQSGYGKENHNLGLEEYTRLKLMSMDLTE